MVAVQMRHLMGETNQDFKHQSMIEAFYNSSTNPMFEVEAGFDYFQNQGPIIRNSTARSSGISERAPLISRRASNPRSADDRSSQPPTESQPTSAAILPLNPAMEETRF